MKIDRLLGLVMYLANRDMVPGRVLAEKFEVSPRTIQRDIEALNMAGIPVVSILGVNGGYGIMDGFKLDKQILNTDDYLFIITALRGLCTAYENRRLQTTLEKWLSLLPLNQDMSKIQLDFGVLREGTHTSEYLKIIETAISNERVVVFEYTNTANNQTRRQVEPVVVTYKWYAWYLFGFCLERQDYRLFRLSRIRKLVITDTLFSTKHENADKLLNEHEKRDHRQYLNIKLQCEPDCRISIEEYFPKVIITELPTGQLLCEFSLPEDERGWLGILMSYGAQVKVLEPEKLKKIITQNAKEIIEIYK